jgi:hypothetical protein
MANTNTRTKAAAAAPEPINPADLLAQALAASLKASASNGSRKTAQTHTEQLAQPLTARDRAALDRMGWVGKLSSAKPAEPKPRAKIKAGPTVSTRFGDLSPERQASTQFWAGLCATMHANAGKVWLPEVAAVAAHLNVALPSPAQLATRLALLTGCPVHRPADAAGWLACSALADLDPMPAASLWAQLWNHSVQAFGDAIAAS